MMMKNYLTEDIIATSGTYFDTQLNTEVRLESFVIKLMRFGLGADEQKEQELKARIEELEKKIKEEERQKDTDKTNKEQYENQLKQLLWKSKELELIDNE